VRNMGSVPCCRPGFLPYLPSSWRLPPLRPSFHCCIPEATVRRPAGFLVFLGSGINGQSIATLSNYLHCQLVKDRTVDWSNVVPLNGQKILTSSRSIGTWRFAESVSHCRSGPTPHPALTPALTIPSSKRLTRLARNRTSSLLTTTEPSLRQASAFIARSSSTSIRALTSCGGHQKGKSARVRP